MSSTDTSGYAMIIHMLLKITRVPRRFTKEELDDPNFKRGWQHRSWLEYERVYMLDDKAPTWGDHEVLWRIEVPEHDKVVIVPCEEVIPLVKQWIAEYGIEKGQVGERLDANTDDTVCNLMYTEQTGLRVRTSAEGGDEDVLNGTPVDIDVDEHYIVHDTDRNSLDIVLPEDYEKVASWETIRTDLEGLVVLGV